jgi:hypothetical protein
VPAAEAADLAQLLGSHEVLDRVAHLSPAAEAGDQRLDRRVDVPGGHLHQADALCTVAFGRPLDDARLVA